MSERTFRIFVINPGSTSTKLALFENSEKVLETKVFHDADILCRFPTVNHQLEYRLQVIRDFLRDNAVDLKGIDAIVGRGGSCAPVASGVYEVNEKMVEDMRLPRGGMDHPSNLGAQLAQELQKEYGGRTFMVDPTCVDELDDLARMTGIDGMTRHLHIHALNMRGVAMQHAKHVLHKDYKDCNLIVAHIDGGMSISAHHNGRMIDTTDGGGGEGPYTPTRIGTVSAAALVDYCRGRDLDEVKRLTIRTGGFVSYFGTSNSDTVHEMMEQGNHKATLVWNGMIYQICKCIGSMSAVLEGKVDGILLTGGLLRFKDIAETIERRCGWIAPITLYPDEVEHEAMAAGALRVLRGEEEPKIYTGEPVWKGFED